MGAVHTEATGRGGRGSLGYSRYRKAFAWSPVIGIAPGPGLHNFQVIRAPQGFVFSDCYIGLVHSTDAFSFSYHRGRDPLWAPPTVQDMEAGTRLPVMDFHGTFQYPSTAGVLAGHPDMETSGVESVLLCNWSEYQKLSIRIYGSFTPIVVY